MNATIRKNWLESLPNDNVTSLTESAQDRCTYGSIEKLHVRNYKNLNIIIQQATARFEQPSLAYYQKFEREIKSFINHKV